MEKINPLQQWRTRLTSATTKEELAQRTAELVAEFPNRYKPLREYLDNPNQDIETRLKFLKNEVQGDFLDIGSYDGFFVFELEEDGYQAVGIDMMEEALTASREEQRLHHPNSHARFEIGYAEDIPFESETFDTTIASHTLEHVFDPATAISEAMRVTKNGGKLIVIVPHDLDNDPTHLRVVDPVWLEDELSKYGLKIKQEIVGEGVAFVYQRKI